MLEARGTFARRREPPPAASTRCWCAPHAHARIARWSIVPALQAPGVSAVYTGADVARNSLGAVQDDAQALPTRRLAHVRAAAPRAAAPPVTWVTRWRWWWRRPRRRRRTPPTGCAWSTKPLPAVTDTAAAANPMLCAGLGRVSGQRLQPVPVGHAAATDVRLHPRPPRGPAPLHPRARAVHGSARRPRRLRPGRDAIRCANSAIPAVGVRNALATKSVQDPGARSGSSRATWAGPSGPRAGGASSTASDCGHAQARPAGEVALRAAGGDPTENEHARDNVTDAEQALNAEGASSPCACARSPTWVPTSRPTGNLPAPPSATWRPSSASLLPSGRARRGPVHADRRQLHRAVSRRGPAATSSSGSSTTRPASSGRIASLCGARI